MAKYPDFKPVRSYCFLCATSHKAECPLTPEQREAAILKRIAMRGPGHLAAAMKSEITSLSEALEALQDADEDASRLADALYEAVYDFSDGVDAAEEALRLHDEREDRRRMLTD